MSELAMIKLFGLKTGHTNTIKVKCIRKSGFLDLTNNSSEILIFSKDEVLGTVGLKSIGYYKVQESTIQHNLQYYLNLNL